MKRGKRAVLFAVCAVVVTAFALTGCAGGEAKGEQVTKEQYEQILTKMLEAFPNVPQKANAAMAAEETELLNFIIRQKCSINLVADAERELLYVDSTLETDDKKIKMDVSLRGMISGGHEVETELYMAEINGVCWIYGFFGTSWKKFNWDEIEAMPGVQQNVDSSFESIRFTLTLLKDKFDLFEFQNGKYVCKAEETPKMLAYINSLNHTDGTQVDELSKNYKNASLSLRFADDKLTEISAEYIEEGSELFGTGKIKNATQLTFTDYGKAKVTLPTVA